jgi:H2-forming N5,N10-methylenetetrahydromethanopterin dehydrogenase-like enzyme
MQYKRMYIPFDNDMQYDSNDGQSTVLYSPNDGERTLKADKEIRKNIEEGWKIVSTCPITASINLLHDRGRDDVYATYTQGIEVFMVKDD